MDLAFYAIFVLGALLFNSIAVRCSLGTPETAILNLFWISFCLLIRKSANMAIRRFLQVSKDFEKLKLVYEAEHDDIGILFSLNKISLHFSEKKDIDSVLSSMLSEISGIFLADITVIEIMEDAESPPSKLLKGAEDFLLDPNIYQKIERGSSVLINNLCPEHSEYERYPLLYGQGVVSFLVAPLKVAGTAIGLIGLFSRKQHDFTGSDLRRLSTFATHGGLIIENARLLEKTRRLSITDELTQLNNFRHFRKKLEEEISRARRYGYTLSLVMCDIDSFKNYNDTNGHEAGNEALKKLANVLKNSVRDIDFVARYGGEEFAVLLIETSKENAGILAERIRKSVEKEVFAHQEKQPGGNFTVTMGVGTYPDDGETPAQIIEKADRALYTGKKSGKNTVVSA